MFRKRTHEIDTAFKPIVRERQISAAGMIAYLAVVFSALCLMQYVVIYIFNKLYELDGDIGTVFFPIALISVLIILVWSIRFVHFPVVLVLAAIYIIWLYSQITAAEPTPNSLQSLLNELIRGYSDYYGFTWSGFRSSEVKIFYTDEAFRNGRLLTLALLYLPLTFWLGYNLIRKFRISSVAVVLVLPCFLVLMNGYTPDRFAFLLIILLFAVVGVVGVQMKIEEKQQAVRSKGSDNGNGFFCLRPPKAVLPLYGVALAAVVAAMAFPILFEEKMTELVKPAQDFMYSGGPERLLKELRGRIFGTASGGISGGDLASTGSIKPDKDHVLLKTWRASGLNSRYTYLKCFVGEVYTGKRWTDLPDIIRNQYREEMNGSGFDRRGYQLMESIRPILETLAYDNEGNAKLRNHLNMTPYKIYITNVDYADGYKIVPYLADLGAGSQTALQPYSEEEMPLGSTVDFDMMYSNLPFLVRLYDAYMHDNGYMGAYTASPKDLADYFYNELYSRTPFEEYSQASGRMIPEILFRYYGADGQTGADAAYEHILQEYLNVPESVVKLREYMKDVRVDGVEDAVIYVRDTLAEMAEYSLNPGKISGSTDFVDAFLFDKKAGYCMHFASAGTLMFRLLGIPARYVEGFYISPSATEEQNLTEENAHAWVEIYLRNLGWIPIEVTPGFGSSDEWKKEDRPIVTPSTPAHTETERTTESSSEGTGASTATKTQPTASKTPSETKETIVPGGSMGFGTLPSVEKEEGASIWPVIFKILKVVAILLGILLALYLLIFFRRSFILTRRNRGFVQRDLRKSVAAMYADMKRLAAIEHRKFTYETDATEVVSWFDELADHEELFTEAIEKINQNFFGNRPIEPKDRKTIAKARNKLAAAVAKRQTGRKKLRYHLWYGY